MHSDVEHRCVQPELGRRKVFFLLPSLIGGGAQRVASLLIPHLAGAFDLTVVLLEDERVFDFPEEIKTVAVSKGLNGQLSHLLKFPFHLLSLIKVARRNKAEVVLSFMEEVNILNILASMVTGHKAVISQRIVPLLQHQRKGLLGRVLYNACKLVYPKATHVVVVSSQLKNIMTRDFSLPPDRVSFIPNPVDLARLSQEAWQEPDLDLPERYVLHVGRLDLRQKGQDVLLRSFASLRDECPGICLVLLGEGPDRTKIEMMISELGLKNRVILAGWSKNVACVMRRAEVFVLSSRYEGWPNALAEAMACGCPVIATDCETGPREILGEGRYGMIVPNGDTNALAGAIRTLCLDANKREALSRQARMRAEEFALSVIASGYVQTIADRFGVI